MRSLAVIFIGIIVGILVSTLIVPDRGPQLEPEKLLMIIVVAVTVWISYIFMFRRGA